MKGERGRKKEQGVDGEKKKEKRERGKEQGKVERKDDHSTGQFPPAQDPPASRLADGAPRSGSHGGAVAVGGDGPGLGPEAVGRGDLPPPRRHRRYPRRRRYRRARGSDQRLKMEASTDNKDMEGGGVGGGQKGVGQGGVRGGAGRRRQGGEESGEERSGRPPTRNEAAELEQR
jgi:hypothetical protein